MVEIEFNEDTKYEKARMIGSRALQISMGAPIMLNLSKKDLEALKYNPVAIARKEYEEGKLPIDVKRVLPHQDNKMY